MRLQKLLFLPFLFFAYSSQANDSLLSAVAKLESAAKEHIVDGTIEAVKKATISAQVSGRITQINFDVDDFVKKGEVILRIRDTEYKARLQNTKAALKEAKASLRDAQLELKRVKGLYQDKMVSEAIYDKAKAQLKSAEARVAASEAKITEAKEQLDNTIVRAPYSGVVIERHIELGESAQPGKPVMTGFSLEQLRVAVDVPQSYINAVRKYQSARIIPLTKRTNPIDVKNMTIFPFANPQTHSFHVRANLKPGTKDLYPGMLVKVGFKVDETKRLLIPQSAVVRRSEVVAIYILNENENIQLRQVRLGHSFDGKIEVLAGLSEGEKVATDPVKAGIMLKQQMGSTHE